MTQLLGTGHVIEEFYTNAAVKQVWSPAKNRYCVAESQKPVCGP